MSKQPIVKIEPSIFAADFGKLADEAKRAEDSGADAIHFDIMDGHFAPNLSLSQKSLAAVNKATDLYLDVHIMVYNPYEYIERLIECGADSITFHFEATEDVEDTLQYIRKCNVKAGLAFCPETTVTMATKYLDKCDLILLMTVHPGFGGQAFLPKVLDKIRFLRDACNKLDIRQGGVVVSERSSSAIKKLPGFDLQVDGGVDDKTAPLCVEAGANLLVSGSYLYKALDMRSCVDNLRSLKPKEG
ncbi:ribulose-phosphate 3-epimerase [Candidatus Aerophobetes bacterium]|uniref:Ribulose-phosphate 3-epimerase n=1 Tax=Aerophobetes bacterium TaxID=2030807 RepID=A0A2A4YEV2_UNCAE|nr:MAG: ribulose-phosphate 3-epimerase [Candidatus Aerophobetes bacterium]